MNKVLTFNDFEKLQVRYAALKRRDKAHLKQMVYMQRKLMDYHFITLEQKRIINELIQRIPKG